MKKRPSRPPKRHHFRPRWYLKGFSVPSTQEHCHSLKVDSGYPLCNTNINNLAVVKDFFRIFDDVAGMEPLTADFDGIASKVFANIISKDGLTCNSDEFEVVLEFISRMITFDNISRDTISKGLELVQEPSVVEERRQIPGDPLPLLLMSSLLPTYREIVNNLHYKLIVAEHNSFLCPDSLFFTATRAGEIILLFPIDKNLCLYGCSSEVILEDFFPPTSLVNTLLLLHSHQFIYFSDWDLKIYNSISEISIKKFKNRGIDSMLQCFIPNIKNTIDIVLPNKEFEFYNTIMDKFINFRIGSNTFSDMMDEISPSWNSDKITISDGNAEEE